MCRFENINLNVNCINSISSFADVKNNVSENSKDVYFVEIYGYDNEQNIVREILDMDKKLDNMFSYYRDDTFPDVISFDDSKYYSDISKIKYQMTDTIKKRYEKALYEIKNIFIKNNKNASETIIKNFIVKIMYWCDYFFPKIFKKHNEDFLYKFAYCGDLKKNEYMFLYFLVLMGVDVIYINTKNNTNIDIISNYKPIILKYDNLGSIDICKYESKNTGDSKNIGDSKNNNVVINMKEISRKRNSITENKNSENSTTKISLSSIEKPQKFDKELDFEEIAYRLANRVVMINVNDEKGEYMKSGSGFFINNDGFILTNFHVLQSGDVFNVNIENDENVYISDQIIKYDYENDIAIIKIDKKSSFLKMYNDPLPLSRGQKVVAIGSPLGFLNTISNGIISGFRTIENTDFIQFTAPISRGSSGGALLNIKGEVIGITTGGFDSGQNINIAVSYTIINNFIRGFL